MSGGSNSNLELDFFGMEKETTGANPDENHFGRSRRSFPDIQSVISKINPEVVKAVLIGSGCSAASNTINAKPPRTPSPSWQWQWQWQFHQQRQHHQYQPTLPANAIPVYTPAFRPIGDCGSGCETAPLTIFYNGTVAVADAVPRNKVDYILKFAQGEYRFTTSSSIQSNSNMNVGNKFKSSLPLARRRSLERFLEKRKQRLVMGSPYIKGKGVPSQINPGCF